MTAEKLTRDYNDKRLPVEFVDGVTEEIFVVMVSNSHCHDECDGIVYEALSSTRPGWVKPSDTYWTAMKYVKSFALSEIWTHYGSQPSSASQQLDKVVS